MSPRRIALLLVLAAGGCQTVSESKGTTKTYFKDQKLSSTQIRALTNDYVVRFALRIEGTADRILAGSPSREVSRHALLWKINGISAGFLAASHGDPIAALSDLTILAMQMRRFFEEGAGSSLFGSGQSDAVEVSRQLEQEILEIRQLLSDDKSGLEAGLESMRGFVGRAPLTDLTFVRSSPVREYLTAFRSEDRALFSVVGDINQTVSGLQGLIVVQAAHLPKRMRWEAELLLLDADRSPAVASVTAPLENLPTMVAEERGIILEALTQERTEAMREIGRFRDLTMKELDGLKTTTLDEIRQERRIVLDHVDDQLLKFTRALDGLTSRRVEEAMAGADGLFGRAMQAVFLGGTALAALALGTVFFLRRRP